MSQRRKIYAFVMVAVYTVATLLSSLSLLTCDHHHHHHHICKSECCAHIGLTIDKDCCDHHHPILGDNHTDFIESRNDSRTASALALLLAPAITPTTNNELSAYHYALFERLVLFDIGTPLKSHTITFGLRAPPALA